MAKKPSKNPSDISKCFNKYTETVGSTDQLPSGDLEPAFYGLFSEVGSLISIFKKVKRDEKTYKREIEKIIIEEMGDILWYFTKICSIVRIDIGDLFHSSIDRIQENKNLDISILFLSPESEILNLNKSFSSLSELAVSSSEFLQGSPRTNIERKIDKFSQKYLIAAIDLNVKLESIISTNTEKVTGRFSPPVYDKLQTFDSCFPEHERLPDEFEIELFQPRKEGGWEEKCLLRWKGVIIGDPLTDNIHEGDGYRFHDVFHFAHAAILHWSPTFRALIKHKRKSDKTYDEKEDGGRAIVIEEGLTAWIFSQAKEQELFDGHGYISYDILKTIQDFTRGYEIENCPLYMWQEAILKGYEVFNLVKKNNGGIVIGNRTKRTIEYKELGN